MKQSKSTLSKYHLSSSTMGIKGLTTYVKQNLKLPKQRIKRILMDANAWVYKILRQLGTRHHHNDYRYAKAAFQHTLDKLKKNYAFVMFVFDGVKKVGKLGTTTKRERTRQTRRGPVKTLHLRRALMDTLKRCKIPIYVADYEADDDMPRLAYRHRATVVSSDSDFYVTRLPEGYVDLRDWNQNSAWMKCYTRDLLVVHAESVVGCSIPEDRLRYLGHVLGDDCHRQHLRSVPDAFKWLTRKSFSPKKDTVETIDWALEKPGWKVRYRRGNIDPMLLSIRQNGFLVLGGGNENLALPSRWVASATLRADLYRRMGIATCKELHRNWTKDNQVVWVQRSSKKDERIEDFLRPKPDWSSLLTIWNESRYPHQPPVSETTFNWLRGARKKVARPKKHTLAEWNGILAILRLFAQYENLDKNWLPSYELSSIKRKKMRRMNDNAYLLLAMETPKKTKLRNPSTQSPKNKSSPDMFKSPVVFRRRSNPKLNYKPSGYRDQHEFNSSAIKRNLIGEFNSARGKKMNIATY